MMHLAPALSILAAFGFVVQAANNTDTAITLNTDVSMDVMEEGIVAKKRCHRLSVCQKDHTLSNRASSESDLVMRSLDTSFKPTKPKYSVFDVSNFYSPIS